MNFQDFLKKQEEIYNSLRDTSKLKSKGTKPNILNSQGGYLIAFRHPLTISQRVERASRKIAETIPAIIYDSSGTHTTISVLDMRENFTPKQETLERLCHCVKSITIKGKPEIDYLEWLYNQDTVIAAGIPNKDFFEIAQEICSLGERYGIQLRLPWGAHISTSRFTEQLSPEKLTRFIKLMERTPVLGKSTPEFIDVGYFYINPRKFRLTTYARFKI